MNSRLLTPVTTAIIVMVLVICCPALLILFVNYDIPNPDTRDLTRERPPVSAEENAYTYFSAATHAFFWPTNTTFSRASFKDSSTDQKQVQETIEKNSQALQLIQKGTACQICLTPPITNFISDTPPPLLHWKELGLCLALKSRQDRFAHRYMEATDTCISLLRFGNLVQKNPENFGHYLLGLSILETGLRQVRDLASSDQIPSEELNRLSVALAALTLLDQGFIRASKGEYEIASNCIDQFRASEFDLFQPTDPYGKHSNAWLNAKLIPSYVFQPNKTKLALANHHRTMIKNAPLTYAEMSQYDAEEVLGLRELDHLFFCPNSIGKLFQTLFVPATKFAPECKCRSQCSITATHLTLACNIYKRQKGKLPATLSELVPVCLSIVPADPFDGKPFRYSQTKAIVYSVGKDLIDSNGSTRLSDPNSESKGRWNMEDAVFEIQSTTETGNTSGNK